MDGILEEVRFSCGALKLIGLDFCGEEIGSSYSSGSLDCILEEVRFLCGALTLIGLDFCGDGIGSSYSSGSSDDCLEETCSSCVEETSLFSSTEEVGC